LGANQFILKSIANYHLPFRKKPPLKFPTQKFLECLSTKVSPEMTQMVKDLKCKGILEKPLASDPGFFSKMFLIKKPDGGLRPIFDLKALNTFVATKHFYLISQLVKISEARRSPDRQVRSLFVSITGVLRPASKIMIAGWVRSAFKLAKIDASPGSIRSAVASRRWLDNRPVQEILDRGNWKCLETFSKHYCKEISNPVNSVASDLLYDNFKTV
ncbi:hypothetical protein HF086_001173, partial [Spodoptera exigua]